MTAPLFRVTEIAFLDARSICGWPFRFGVVTLTRATQRSYARASPRADGRDGWGAAAELLAPKWFDKTWRCRTRTMPNSCARRCARRAASILDDPAPRSAFGHSRAHYARADRALRRPEPQSAGRVLRAGADRSRGAGCAVPIARCLGLRRARPQLGRPRAGHDRARPRRLRYRRLARRAGAARTASRRATRSGWSIRSPPSIRTRAAGSATACPKPLEEVVAAYGHRWFKLKVGGDIDQDITRLRAIAGVLEPQPGALSLQPRRQRAV